MVPANVDRLLPPTIAMLSDGTSNVNSMMICGGA
jgi:hypothetical protein